MLFTARDCDRTMSASNEVKPQIYSFKLQTNVYLVSMLVNHGCIIPAASAGPLKDVNTEQASSDTDNIQYNTHNAAKAL